MPPPPGDGDAPPNEIHLLDVGTKKYGDAILCRFGETTILIDGAHPGDQELIQEQLGQLLGQSPPFRVSLLIVTHAHLDHIGCLPHLIENDLLRADWALVADPDFGWNRDPDDGDADPDAVLPDAAMVGVAAALREEPLSAAEDDATLIAFLSDAAEVEPRYREMLRQLTQATGSDKVFRWGRGDATPLLGAFAHVGLRILGPSKAHLEICADRVFDDDETSRGVVDAAAQDGPIDPLDLYRRAVSGRLGPALADAQDRLGAAVNNQSLVLRFEYGGRRFLLTGDMQLADPEVTGLEDEMETLRVAIERDGPYDFVKLPHHGSANAFDAAMLARLGDCRLFGISTGSRSDKHPSSATLNLLASHRPRLRWGRTDRNGMVGLDFEPETPSIDRTRGRANDATAPISLPDWNPEPPGGSVAGSGPSPAAGPGQTGASAAPPQQGGGTAPQEAVPNVVEVVAKIPHTSTKVTITVEIAPGAAVGAAVNEPTDVGGADGAEPLGPIRIAGGRQLPRLLFATNRTKLGENIGRGELEQVLRAIRAAGHAVDDEMPTDPAAAARGVERARAAFAAQPDLQGIVLLGGYDVVPSFVVDAVGNALRSRLGENHDDRDDDFFVWSDDRYGDIDGDGLPERPVSRIPDGGASTLVAAAIQAGGATTAPSRAGVRNVNRPFADSIFAGMPGSAAGAMAKSQPTRADQRPPLDVAADHVYLMLHGEHTDPARFKGEDEAEWPVAFTVANVPARPGMVVFCGCCWGALTVDQIASRAYRSGPPARLSPQRSIALAFLQAGARAFVGSTGLHYSPVEPPQEFLASAPLHTVFWQQVAAGVPPARALLDAKYAFVRTIIRGSDPEREAIGLKTVHQFTCLGLGW